MCSLRVAVPRVTFGAMFVLEGESERLALQLGAGDRLPDVLTVLAGRGAGGFVEGAATLAEVTLIDAAGGQKRLPFAEALRLTATVRGDEVVVHATLVADGVTRGGRLASAIVVSGAMSAVLFDEVSDGDEVGDTDEPLAWASVVAASTASTASTGSSDEGALGWAQVAAVSDAASRVPARPAPRGRAKPTPTVPLLPKEPLPGVRARPSKAVVDLDEPTPERNDWVSHRQFGLCKVERVHEDGGLLVKLPTARRKLIKLDPFVVRGPRLDGQGRRVFDLEPRRKA